MHPDCLKGTTTRWRHKEAPQGGHRAKGEGRFGESESDMGKKKAGSCGSDGGETHIPRHLFMCVRTCAVSQTEARHEAITLLIFPIILFHNAQNFAQFCLRRNAIMPKLFHTAHGRRIGHCFTLPGIVSGCRGPSVSPTTKLWVTDR